MCHRTRTLNREGARIHIHIDPSSRRPIYVQIIDEIRRAIALGDLRPDDALPSVRQMAADLRINPHTVAQAYRELEHDGLVSVRRGHGTFVTAPSAGEAERRALARGVAERALVDAHRHGVTIDELIEAIREVRESDPVMTTAEAT